MDATLDALLKSEPGLWRGRDRYNDEASVPTGFAALDAVLPARGWSVGGITELLVHRHGIGETSLLLPALRDLTGNGQWAAFVNPPHVPYAPALANAGIRLERLLIVDTKTDADALWSAEQMLRASVFAAVVVWVERSSSQKQRRLQLAAETGATWGTVYRPARDAGEHSPVSLRMALEMQGRRLSLELLKVRGGNPGQVSIDPVEFDRPQGVEWPGMMEPDEVEKDEVVVDFPVRRRAEVSA